MTHARLVRDLLVDTANEFNELRDSVPVPARPALSDGGVGWPQVGSGVP